MRSFRSAAALASILALAGAAYQQAPTAPKTGAPSPPIRGAAVAETSPERVLARIHAINDMEITAARLASQKSRDSEVIRFARLLGRDHRLADEELSRLAAKAHWGVGVAAPDARDEAAMSALRDAAVGPEFDRAYVEAMRAGHDQTLSELSADRAAASDLRLRGFIEKLLPVLRQHRALADELLKKRLT